MKLLNLLIDPFEFFEKIKDEGWKDPFKFFLSAASILSIATPIVNYFGIEGTDISSAYQAQILAYKKLKDLPPTYGIYAYLIETFLILGFGIILLVFITMFLHLSFKLMGGEGSILNGWKASCYGVGPCILGGFSPYISLFVAFYSLLIQFYVGPKVLYRVKESRAIFSFRRYSH